MHLITRLMRALGWPAPAVHVPKRQRRPVTLCGRCGHMYATGKNGLPWRHNCHPLKSAQARFLTPCARCGALLDDPSDGGNGEPVCSDCFPVDEDDERGGRR